MSGIQLRAGVITHGSIQGFRPGIDVPSVTISLNEEADSTARWLIKLKVKTNTGEYFVGSVLTLPPGAPGSSSSRVILIATIPGAISWSIIATLQDGTGDANSLALLDMSTSECCGTLGITALHSELLTSTDSEGGFARVLHLSTNLPGAGAFTAQPFTPINGLKSITYWVTYTPVVIGGYPALRAQWNNGVETSIEAVEDLSSLVIVNPIGTTNLYRQELLGPIQATLTPIVFPVVFNPPDQVTGARLIVAERGLPATPGNVQITITGSN